MIVLDISYCDHQESPNDLGPWRLASFNRRHASFVNPTEAGVGPHGCTKLVNRRLAAGTAWLLGCYQHSGELWARKESPNLPKCEFDTCTRAGLLTWEKRHGHRLPKGLDARRESADAFLRMYTSWCNGDVYEMRLEVDDECEDSMWWYGSDTEQLQHAVKWVVSALRGRKIDKLSGDNEQLISGMLPRELLVKDEP